MAWEAGYESRRTEADLGPNGRTTSKMHFSRREWTRDSPEHGHKTERYGTLFAKPLHLTVEEARLCEVKNLLIIFSKAICISFLCRVLANIFFIL
jgi:hypothetical protein